MHWSGKLFAWLAILAGIGGSLLTAKLIEVRNSWTRKEHTFAEDYRKIMPEVLKARKEASDIQAEYNRVSDYWGYTWNDIPTQVASPAEGKLAIEIGTNQGVAEKMWVYGFEQVGETSIFRGEFIVATLRENQSLLTPTFRLRPNEVQQWQPGRWRWRSQLPAGYLHQERLQQQQLTSLDERIGDLRLTVQTHERVLAKAQEQLAIREAELVGGEKLSQDPALDPEFRQGLVATLEETEEARNALLVTVNDLRLKLRDVQKQLETLQAENLELASQLPQPAKPELTATETTPSKTSGIAE